ncbi:hypothetical protein CASFOL_021731 [Castilleja foliolosa]|uniref:Protein kinase domain-containing protein n=1 Tax=Castilleja foliolosa TaxID=1961234 RepID=A0ABD3CYA9_9LAMI
MRIRFVTAEGVQAVTEEGVQAGLLNTAGDQVGSVVAEVPNTVGDQVVTTNSAGDGAGTSNSAGDEAGTSNSAGDEAGTSNSAGASRMEIGAGIAKGLIYLHTKGIIYRGLRPGKVLLGEGYRPKLFDFKCAVSVPSGGPLSIVPNDVLVGPYPYRAPEVSLINKLVTPKADVYSFGVVLRQMISGLERGSNWLHPDSFELRPHREIDNVFPIENWMKATTLVNQCMQEIPESRPDMSIVERGMRFLANEPNVIWPVELAEPRI